ncbi:hypothetical protein [Methylobacterium sp. Gmos1]
MGVPAYNPDVAVWIDRTGASYAMRTDGSRKPGRLIIIEVEGDDPTEKQLYTMECMFVMLDVHYNLAALHLCPAILPHLERIKNGKAQKAKPLLLAQDAEGHA